MTDGLGDDDMGGAADTSVVMADTMVATPPIAPSISTFQVPKGASAAYAYQWADGSAAFFVVRWEALNGHDKKRFQQWSAENNTWAPKQVIPSGKRPLAKLPDLTLFKDMSVLVVEGEKAMAAASALVPDGWIVTTWAGGTGGVKTPDWSPLQDRQVVIWPDNDPAGIAAAKTIREFLPHARIIDLPLSFPEKWDLADPLPEGFSVIWIREIITAAENTPQFQDTADNGNSFSDLSPNKSSDPDDFSEEFIRLSRLDPIQYGRQRRNAAKNIGISVSLLDKEVKKHRRQIVRAADENYIDFILADNGAVQPIFANAAALLRASVKDWPLRFDEFSQRPFLGQVPMNDGDLQAIAEWVQRRGVTAARKIIDDAVLHVANQNRFHEVKDWLESLAWDGIARANLLLVDHAGAPDIELTHAFTSKWLIQAVARIYEPGCQADATLILEGAQDLGKSSLLRALFGDRWFTDHLPDLASKDAMIQLLGIWCIEMSELAAIGRSDTAKTKQFLTSRDDRFRMPWDRLAAPHPRQSVFAGTVNPGASGYLKDETGGRRFWPILVSHIDVAQVLDRREQIWAEAVTRYKSGETWHLGQGDLNDAATAAQDDRYVGDPWQNLVEKFVRHRTYIQSHEILENCIGIPKSDWSQPQANRVARCMAFIGWTRKSLRIEGDRDWYYVPEDHTGDNEPK